ncbi:hypothetical protein HLB44_10205 [Aquincola sp. S2]|uniref:Uncharacterized protein n=1 Tax=Pseudaquabacterium terrae TaxID=2732868 RepID=A0ABX2EFI9_9BURK|nr:hypothetical protein [Aquabacterium terrae]NRF67356.1 hypothetical protein [Aquabacterium terrae]
MNRTLTALRRFTLGALAATLLSGASATEAESTTAASGPTKRSLSLRARVTETVIFTGAPPCFAISTVQGSGRSNVLGRFTMNAQDCINPQGAFDPAGRNAFNFSSLPTTLIFTAANGDRVHATYSGTLNRRGHLRGHFVITGGTGQFFGATGGGTLSGDLDTSQIVTTHGTMDADGEIVY